MSSRYNIAEAAATICHPLSLVVSKSDMVCVLVVLARKTDLVYVIVMYLLPQSALGRSDTFTLRRSRQPRSLDYWHLPAAAYRIPTYTDSILVKDKLLRALYLARLGGVLLCVVDNSSTCTPEL